MSGALRQERLAFRFAPYALFAAFVLLTQTGCPVPQQRGQGRVLQETEPETRTNYYLYLPADYVARDGQRPDGQRWPLVVTFHGMRPWDDAKPQIKEWEAEADRYNFVVVAPELRTCDSFMQYPLEDPSLSYVQKDERGTIAIMDEVFRRTNADPNRVLATSWSAGGYMAHFMVNRYPERFSCLAVRQSNFSESLLDPLQVPRYRHMKVAIFFGENDFKVCREESRKAVLWYRRHNFAIEAKEVRGLGHERTPQTAAAFFAATIGARPKTPPPLGDMVMYDVSEEELRNVQLKSDSLAPAAGPKTSSSSRRSGYDSDPANTGTQGNLVFNNSAASPRPPSGPERVAPVGPMHRNAPPTRVQSPNSPTPKRNLGQPYSSDPELAKPELDEAFNPLPPKAGPEPMKPRLRIQSSSDAGVPQWVNLGVDLPPAMREGASILWLANNQPIGGNFFEWCARLELPGEHEIEARIVTAQNEKIVLKEKVRINSSQPA